MASTDAALTPPDGAVLVRVTVGLPGPPRALGWVRDLPPVPAGATVTITVSDPRMLAVPADDLVSSGYRLVGARDGGLDAAASRGRAPRAGTGTVDLLVTRELATTHPDWFATLLARADRAFDLRLGPVQHVLAGVIRMHLAASA